MSFSAEGFQQEMQQLEQEFTHFVDAKRTRGVVTGNDIPALLSMLVEMERLQMRVNQLTLEKMKEDTSSFYVVFGEDGDNIVIPPGKTVLNPVKGFATLGDGTKVRMTSSFGSAGLDHFHSAYLFADANPRCAIDAGSLFRLPNSGWTILKGRMSEITLFELTEGFVGKAIFCENRTPVFDSWNLPSEPFRRHADTGSNGTLDSFTAVRWSPYVASLDTLIAEASRNSVLGTGHLGRKTIMVHNGDTADSIDINLQGRIVQDPSTWADDSTTGASLAVAADTIQILDVSKRWQQMRLRVQSTVAGSPGRARCSFLADIGSNQ